VIELMIAAALAQNAAHAAPAHCDAVGRTEAHAPGCRPWRLVRRDPDGRGYMDPDSARRDGDAVDIMLRTVFTRPLDGGARTLDARVRFDCARRTKMLRHITAYTADGALLFDADIATDPAAAPPAGSPFAAVLDEVCPRGSQEAR
jgi:hypothetical protein